MSAAPPTNISDTAQVACPGVAVTRASAATGASPPEKAPPTSRPVPSPDTRVRVGNCCERNAPWALSIAGTTMPVARMSAIQIATCCPESSNQKNGKASAAVASAPTRMTALAPTKSQIRPAIGTVMMAQALASVMPKAPTLAGTSRNVVR